MCCALASQNVGVFRFTDGTEVYGITRGLLNTNTYGNPARTEMTDTDTEDGGVHGGVKGSASTYVLCPHLTDGAFQFKRGRERQERSGERE